MQPRIDRTRFGSVTIDGKEFTHDVLIRLGGQVQKRKKKLSKAVYGTAHTISLAEAKHLYQKGAARLLIGAGQDGTVALSESEEAATYLERHRCQVELLPTPAVIPAWTQAEGRHRHAPRDLLSKSRPRRPECSRTGLSQRGRALPHPGRGRRAEPAAQRGPVRCRASRGRGRLGPHRSSSIATSRAADGWAAWERHTTRSLPSGSHSRTWPGQGHGSTSSSGQRRPQLGHHAVPALELRRWPRSSGQTGHGSPHSGL
jgi:hypothetical protein